MKRKYFLGAILFIVVLSMQLIGCTKSSDSKGPAKITVWAWDPNFNIAIMNEAKERYLKINPDVEFDIVEMGKGDIEQKLQTMLASGVTDSLPDIVLIEDYNAQKYLTSFPGSFAELTTEFDYSEFLPYKVGVMSLDKKIYGVPFDTGASGFFYRADILKEAGYKPEDLVGITWKKYLEIGEAVKAKTGKYMLPFDPNDGYLVKIMLQSAGAWYTDQNGVVDIENNAALKEALEMCKMIGNSKCAKPISGWGELVGSFNGGDTASVVSGIWMIGAIKSEQTQSGKWMVAPTPRLEISGAQNASNLGGSSWYVLDSSKHKAAAIDFLKQIYANDTDFYQKILVERGAVGSYIPAHSGEAYNTADDFFSGQKVFADFSEWNKKIPSVSYGSYTYEAENVIMAKMQAILKGADIQSSLQEAQGEIESKIK